eukprot:6456710-Amphidinium_carterae.1
MPTTADAPIRPSAPPSSPSMRSLHCALCGDLLTSSHKLLNGSQLTSASNLKCTFLTCIKRTALCIYS